jgi:hypothetical protein
MPLLTMRINEYYAEILGEEHSEYQFIKNISKRIFGSFLIQKIEPDGFLIEHLSSKKQLWLSNEFTSLEKMELIENKTVLSLGLVQWKNDIWQNQGVCMVNTIDEMEGEDVSKHIFDDENKKKEIIHKLEKAFLEITASKRIVYFRETREYAEFHLKVIQKYTKMVNPEITDEKLNETYESDIKKYEDLPFEKDEAFCVFFNSSSGMELYRESVISCMPDETNPYYDYEKFDLYDLITDKTLSTNFVNYIIENKIINIYVNNYYNPNMFRITMENLDFLLRFYRRSRYFSKPEVTI